MVGPFSSVEGAGTEAVDGGPFPDVAVAVDLDPSPSFVFVASDGSYTIAQ
jgi:hypothetical protein